MKKAVIMGAGGFVGTHLCIYLKKLGYYVIGYDRKEPIWTKPDCDEFYKRDLRVDDVVYNAMTPNRAPGDTVEVYQLAADMGGAGYIFTGAHDADVMINSATINLNVAKYSHLVDRIFFSSSACIYPAGNQTDPDNPVTNEASVYPANPDSEYGWEKLFSERLYQACTRNYGVPTRIARFHNVYGPLGTFEGGREKAPAATCRKVINAAPGDAVEVWGDGKQTRSFLYVDDCVEGIYNLMQSDISQPLNIGSDEMISIDGLTEMAIAISHKALSIKHIDGPVGVRGRTSDNTLCKQLLGWEPKIGLRMGMQQTYEWIESQIKK